VKSTEPLRELAEAVARTDAVVVPAAKVIVSGSKVIPGASRVIVRPFIVGEFRENGIV
jgi:hypothetical protein